MQIRNEIIFTLASTVVDGGVNCPFFLILRLALKKVCLEMQLCEFSPLSAIVFADLNLNRLKFELVQELIQKNIIFESESIQIQKCLNLNLN